MISVIILRLTITLLFTLSCYLLSHRSLRASLFFLVPSFYLVHISHGFIGFVVNCIIALAFLIILNRIRTKGRLERLFSVVITITTLFTVVNGASLVLKVAAG
ncbi:MAG: hypothetical protein PQJ60_00265, partial [Spirochaetales bacterium]|nr:hypothetical protein [Spirochaetales bacterium]